MVENQLPAHTRLSASSAEIWMNCPESIALAERFNIQDAEESEFSAEGTAAHELAAHCLKNNLDAWECIGQEFYRHTVTADMAVHVQMYLDFCRNVSEGADFVEIETRVDNPEFHPDFGGTADFTAVGPAFIHVVDLKYGAGIAKDAKDNPQIMYYAYGKLLQLEPDLPIHVGLSIVQPRAFHSDGPIREVWLSVDELKAWGETKLRPAMLRVDEPDRPLKAGDHCRFCPAMKVCPVMTAMFNAAALADPESAKELTDQELGLEYEHISQVKMYLRALEKEVYRRMVNQGRTIPGAKVVENMASRVWKPGGEDVVKLTFGDDAYEERKLKSPAGIEKLVGGADIAKEWAFKPHTGYTIAPVTDRRAAITLKPAAATYSGVAKKSA